MLFSIKNARSTYQCMVDNVFKDQIECNVEIYVDDMVIKREREETFISDINETFCKIREVNMNLSPAKCTFGVEDGNFLGYIVSNKGIQENPEKVEAPATMKPPITLKEI